MSETRNTFGKTPVTPKSKKLQPRIDLTAMVSVSFLLIVFFMLSSFLSRSNAMELGMPDHGHITCGPEYSGCIGEERILKILVGKNNKIITSYGEYSFSYLAPKLLSTKDYSLRKELLDKTKEIIKRTGDPKKGLIVIIKPSKESSYGDLVNVLDEMAIVKVPTYAVVDITPEEEKMLAAK